MDLNNKNLEEIKLWVNKFHNIYKYNSSFYTKRESQDILGSKDEVKCRFCGKTKMQTTFKKAAHVVPEFTGNIHVKSKYECDICNLLFGKYENDLASFVGLRRFYLPIGSYGKRRKRVFKLPNSDAEIYSSNRGLEINDLKNEIFEEINGGKTTKCKINKSPFAPLNVYKALVKMVLSLLNDETLINYRKTLNFLITGELDSDIMVKKFAKLSYHAISDCYFEYPIVFTYSKLDNLDEYEEKNNIVIPDKTFIIYFNQFCFQIFLPFDIKDDKISERKNILFHCFPPILTEPKDISIMTLYTDYYHTYRDLSSSIKIKDEKDEFFIRNIIGPVLVEYTDEEHSELLKKYNLRRNKMK